MQQIAAMLKPGIPPAVRIFGWVLVIAGTIFAYVYMFAPGSFFPGVAIDTTSTRFGLYSTGVRILGSVLGIVIALVLNSAALLCLMLATRVFIELGDALVGIATNGAADLNTVALVLLALVEVYFVVMLLRVLKRDATKPASG